MGGGGADFLTDFTSWLRAQNGQGPFGSAPTDNVQRRYLRCGRDLAAWVHIDVLFQGYFDACVYLLGAGFASVTSVFLVGWFRNLILSGHAMPYGPDEGVWRMLEKSAAGVLRKGPPDAVRMSLVASWRRPARRH